MNSDSDETGATPDPALQKFYVTFGQKYRTEPHPVMETAHPDGVVEVSAINEDAARVIVTDKLGAAWAFLYPEDKLDLNHYPLGVLAVL
jgi:hypothetical protein